VPLYSVAASFGVFALVLGIGLIVLYFRLLKSARSYVTLGGNAPAPQRTSLGRSRLFVTAVTVVYFTVTLVAPIGALVFGSLLQYFTVPGVGQIKWTLDNFEFLTSYSLFWRYFVNTMILGAGSATFVAALALVIAWIDVRANSRVSRLLNGLAFMPLAVPGTISFLAFFLVSIGTPLFDTLIIMILAMTSAYLPFSVRLAWAAQLQLGAELEEASLVSGSGTVGSFARINLPLMRSAAINIWIWVFLHSTQNFAVGLILASGASALLATNIYGYYAAGTYTVAAAMLLVLVIFNVIFVSVTANRLEQTTFSRVGSQLN
jgi:iron(III) transport system permease protein